MKKLLSILLLVCLLIPAAVAEDIDLSKLSFDELINLRYAIEAEIISRPEWKEVTVPAGDWVVGVDIPEGSYSIEMAGKNSGNLRIWAKEKNNYSNNGLLMNTTISSRNTKVGKITLKNGNVLEITCEVIVRPVQGLGF